MPPTTYHDRWQAGDRQYTKLALLSLPDKDHFLLFLRMEGKNGYSEDEVQQTTGVTVKRPRTLHYYLEKLGVVYRLNDITHATDLGRRVREAEAAFIAERRKLARAALQTLRKFQLNNPSDVTATERYPDTCDIHPYWAVLRAAVKLGGRLHWDELNRELMRLLRDDQVDGAIERIRQAREKGGDAYDPKQGGSPGFALNPRSHDRTEVGDIRDHICTPWFYRASFGGLLMELPGMTGDGYWTISEDVYDVVAEAVEGQPPAFRSFMTEADWFSFYGSLDDEAIPKTDLRLTTEMRRLPSAIKFDELKQSVKALGGHYKEDVLRQFHSGLNYLGDKHFVILAGVSGTGKTSLVKTYAYAVHGLKSLKADKDPLYFVCSVRPEWTDPSGLTGHFDVFKNHYAVPPFLEAVQTANDYPDSPVFVCLDEMNIARVEYYFADVLSAMETGESLQIHTQATPVMTSLGFPLGRRVKWPRNLFIVGTINIDETTHPLSHKVLDRAVFIDMSEIDLGQLLNSMEGEDDDLKWSVGKCGKVLTGVYDVLKAHDMPFGYRLAREFVLYHRFWSEKDDTRSTAAIDDMLVQKVFAKLRGGREQEDMLNQLAQKLKEAGGTEFEKASGLIERLKKQLKEYGSFHANR